MFETNGYLGFTFAGRHSSEFGLTVVSDGSRYHQNSFSQFSDSIISVPGKNGGYYFGTQLSQREFDIECVFDDITPHIIHKIQHWLYPNIVGWLIFDEQPYKKYLVKLSSVPTFNFIPFDNYKSTQGYIFQKEIMKGEVNFSFYSIEEFGVRNESYELPLIKKDRIIPQQALDSGIIPNNYIRKKIFLPYERVGDLKIIIDDKDNPSILHTIKPQYEDFLSENNIFSLYNAGNGIAKADFHIVVSKNINWPLEINNFDDGVCYRITDPYKTVSKKCNISEDDYYKIEILSSKQEIYLIVFSNNKEKKSDRINIGAHYNHFYPKIYHRKPTEFCVFTQVLNKNKNPEPLFFTYSYDNTEDLQSSDNKNNIGTFEEFQQYWSDYTILTEYNTFNINNIISPAVVFIDYPEDYDYIKNNEPVIKQRLCYLVYPNKFICNNKLTEFIAEYEHTYI